MDFDSLNAKIGLALACIALAAAVWAGVRRSRQSWGRVRRDYLAGRDALIGRDAIVDSITGKEIAPSLPGIGQRMATVEEALVSLANTHTRLNTIEETVEDHAAAIKQLQAQAVERIVSRQESALAFRAMEAAIKAEPDPDDVA